MKTEFKDKTNKTFRMIKIIIIPSMQAWFNIKLQVYFIT